MKKTLIVALVGAFAVTANAGDSKGVTEAAIAPAPALGATLSAGYDTHYFFKGVDNGQNTVNVGIDYALDALPVPVNLGAHYRNPTDGGDVINPGHCDELALSATISGPDMGPVSTWIGYTAYLFPENGGRTGGNTTHEIGAGIGANAGPVDVHASAYYDWEIEGWYFETGVSKGIALGGFDLVLGAGISYQDDYNAAGGDWNHVYVTASLPISLTETATLTPYVGGLFALDAIDGFQDDSIHGGVSLGVSF